MRQHSLSDRRLLIQVPIVLFVVVPSILRADQRQIVQFDLPPTVAATYDCDKNLVSIELRLSSMIETLDPPETSQWVVRCIPRDQAVLIADYAPRTATGSDLATPIQIKKTAEESQSMGVSIDAAYGHLTRANVGSDRGKKNSDTVQFDRVAPLQAVTAAGTIQRGKGVYFKLRWTATQVLEGEKSFHITMRVPQHWRAGLLDVSVIAQSESKSLAPWDREPRIIGQANFAVAAFRAGDAAAQRLANSVAEAEFAVRELSRSPARTDPGNTLPDLLRHVATKLDLDPGRDPSQWVQQMLVGKADPYSDQQLRKLPVPIRIAVLQYADLRDEFMGLKGDSESAVIAAKPAL